MTWMQRFADRLLLSELNAQKIANARLSKSLKFERNRANALQVSRKTANTRATAARKRVRELEALEETLRNPERLSMKLP